MSIRGRSALKWNLYFWPSIKMLLFVSLSYLLLRKKVTQHYFFNNSTLQTMPQINCWFWAILPLLDSRSGIKFLAHSVCLAVNYLLGIFDVNSKANSLPWQWKLLESNRKCKTLLISEWSIDFKASPRAFRFLNFSVQTKRKFRMIENNQKWSITFEISQHYNWVSTVTVNRYQSSISSDPSMRHESLNL